MCNFPCLDVWLKSPLRLNFRGSQLPAVPGDWNQLCSWVCIWKGEVTCLLGLWPWPHKIWAFQSGRIVWTGFGVLAWVCVICRTFCVRERCFNWIHERHAFRISRLSVCMHPLYFYCHFVTPSHPVIAAHVITSTYKKNIYNRQDMCCRR